MAHVVFTVRILVGITLLLFGLDDLMNLFEIDYGKKGAKFVSAVEGTGYLQQVRGSLLMVCGLLFVVARWVPLALILFAPIILNILIFHAFLAPAKITIAAILGVAQVFLAFCYWPYFRALFVMNTPSRYGSVRKGGRSSGGAPRPAPAASGGGGAPRPAPAGGGSRPSAQRPPSSQRPTP